MENIYASAVWENSAQATAEKNSRTTANTWYTIQVDPTTQKLWMYRRGCTSPSNGGNFNSGADYALLGTSSTTGTWLGGWSRTVGTGATACTTIPMDSSTQIYGVQVSYGSAAGSIDLYMSTLELHFGSRVLTIPFSV